MPDVLLALLLLAIVLTGTCAALIQAVRASSDALRATRAVDLAADLTEQLRGAATPAQMQSVLAAWRDRVPVILPVAGLEPDDYASLTPFEPEPADDATAPLAPLLLLRLRWRGAGSGLRELVLPVAGRPGVSP